MRGARLLTALACAALVACSSGGDGDAVERATTTSTTAPSSTTTSFLETTTTTTPSIWPALPTTGTALALVTERGFVLPLTSAGVTTPCARAASVGGRPLFGAHVVLDPGHGGEEPGAVGPTGLLEKDLNLAVAKEAKRILEATGATVVLTRNADYRIAIQTRAEIATRLKPLVFVSIHHNAEPDEQRATPGAETYFQIASPESKRLAGLVYEEVFDAFDDHEIDWAADRDAGAKYRPSSSGGDYYGILRRSAGVPAVLSEAAFISNPAEEALLKTRAFRREEAQAIADAIVRFVATDDPGSGFVTPYPRTSPAGPGGGTDGCVDPPLT